MRTCHSLLALFTVILAYQVQSQDLMEVKALSSHLFVPYGEDVWVNCSTTFANETVYKSRLKKNETQRGPNWLAVKVHVDDWENSTLYCILDKGNNQHILSPTIVMAYALPSNVTIDLPTKLEEETQYKISCKVYDVAPLEYLTINITRGEDVIDSKSFEGPHVANKTTASHIYYYTAGRSDNSMNFSCEAILQLGPLTKTVKSSNITVQTYSLQEKPIITVQKWIENGTSVTAKCSVANGFPPEDVDLNMLIGDTKVDVNTVQKGGGTVEGTAQLNITYIKLGRKDLTCESHLFTLSTRNAMDVFIYELPTVSFALSRDIVDLEENVTAECNVTNNPETYDPDPETSDPDAETYGLFISVDGKEEKMEQGSMITHTFTASRRTRSLDIMCTAYMIANKNISNSSTQTLEVQYPPEFSESLCPSTFVFVEGKKKIFSCDASGNPTPTVECNADGNSINGVAVRTRDMSGIYTCQAKNQKGIVVKIVTVTAEYAPMSPTVTISTNVTIRTGNSLNITCHSDGFPAPMYSWRIPNDAEVTYSPDKSSMIIHTAARTHNGTYTCVTKNVHGQSEAMQEVTIVSDIINIAVIVCSVVGLLVSLVIVFLVCHYFWKKNRKGVYNLLGIERRQSPQKGKIKSESSVNKTSSV
ncbi:intercellular adhesion molecule 5-like [Rhinoderma darwinii]|uniref:intercellular adhesion molecule 5-like n=1 Tax=Rhinoderma darwinii TaxID=43563 RepID=UPI003F67E0CF